MTVVHVVAAIVVAEGEVLAGRRSAHKVSAGFWEFPGGKVEMGETPRDALEREILEELGLSVRALGTFDKSATRVDENLTVLLECLVVALPSKCNVESQDHDAFLWLKPNEISTLRWALPDLPAVEKLAKLISFGELLSC